MQCQVLRAPPLLRSHANAVRRNLPPPGPQTVTQCAGGPARHLLDQAPDDRLFVTAAAIRVRRTSGAHWLGLCRRPRSFLARFSKASGNDLLTPRPEFGFAGLQPGDRWWRRPRWQEALDAGSAPRVVLRATEEGALDHCALADPQTYAVDLA